MSSLLSGAQILIWGQLGAARKDQLRKPKVINFQSQSDGQIMAQGYPKRILWRVLAISIAAFYVSVPSFWVPQPPHLSFDS